MGCRPTAAHFSRYRMRTVTFVGRKGEERECSRCRVRRSSPVLAGVETFRTRIGCRNRVPDRPGFGASVYFPAMEILNFKKQTSKSVILSAVAAGAAQPSRSQRIPIRHRGQQTPAQDWALARLSFPLTATLAPSTKGRREYLNRIRSRRSTITILIRFQI